MRGNGDLDLLYDLDLDLLSLLGLLDLLADFGLYQLSYLLPFGGLTLLGPLSLGGLS